MSGRSLRPAHVAMRRAQELEAVGDRSQTPAQLERTLERVYNLTIVRHSLPDATTTMRSDLAAHQLAEALSDRLRPDQLAEPPPRLLVDAYARHPIALRRRVPVARSDSISRSTPHHSSPKASETARAPPGFFRRAAAGLRPDDPAGHPKSCPPSHTALHLLQAMQLCAVLLLWSEVPGRWS
jgi:hypothetical protein